TPAWVLKALVLLLALGFVPALVFAWVFELTPEGLKRDADVAPEDSIGPRTARRLDQLTILGLIAVVALIAADRFWPRAAVAVGDDDAVVEAGAKPAAVPTPAPAAVSRSGKRLVAVLPFRNRSALPEDAFFAEGIHDDLLTQLSKIAALRVISRTSMMRYQDSKQSIPEIARELGAAVVLEGAVQRAGEQVRVNVQLIDGASDEHLWAENYDRALTTDTLFAIQADIAHAVAKAMQVVLTPSEAGALAAGSTANLEAYEAFLRGKLLAPIDGVTDARLQAAIKSFEHAIKLDPGFADAHARKARAQLTGFWYVLGPRSQRDAARVSLAQAQRLAPDAIETLLAEAYDHYWGQLDYARADAVLKRVLERVPDNAEAWKLRGFVARRDGRFDDALEALRRSLEIDPVDFDALGTLADTNSLLGHFSQAEALFQQARSLGADVRAYTFYFRESQGDAEGAWAAIDGPDGALASVPLRAALLTRDPARIASALSPALWPLDRRKPPDFPEAYALAQAEGLLVTGKRDEAMRLLRDIQARMHSRPDPYPAGWLQNGYYLPCDLPGMLGDLNAVRAAERHYDEAAPDDAWGARDYQFALAIAFARAGDPDRALHYLEAIAGKFGPASYLRFSIQPGLDSVRAHPRYLKLKTAYEAWSSKQPDA
ncbi:MAG: tetratricopeptide repeat protein, partial [Lysobacterales bacterium]